METHVAGVKRNPLDTVMGPATFPSSIDQHVCQRENDGKTIGGTNGTVDRVLKRIHKTKFTGAIFIHAGAGFHSHQNERVHLEACSDSAATMGMKFLKSGASATEAVEVALRVLEDKEITNAGYGSNLSMDGTVECDATIVDHLGRSGACGAVPNIRNPVCLAKLILDKSNQPLSLRRVPPNILVGEGAKNFALENGMQPVPNEHLISKNARDRFLRWQEDLKRAEEKLRQGGTRRTPERAVDISQQYETIQTPGSTRTQQQQQQRDHTSAILTGTWNEGQPDSPHRGSPALETQAPNQSQSNSGPGRPQGLSPRQAAERATLSYAETSLPSSSKSRNHRWQERSTTASDSSHLVNQGNRDGTFSPQWSDGTKNASTIAQLQACSPRGIKRPLSAADMEEDIITDTVGAIAIDEQGHIAAGSSSGGIGMKHRGRIGPAALVGIGTAVVPCDPDDPDKVSVATVTSGTGEHMATTMASQRCADRIYGNTRRGPDGKDVEEWDEDAIMESFITNDFMGHPGVKSCNSAGAIGVMTVKKMRTGYYLYFAHNTDSFALASMGGSDKEPVCVMSRLGESAQVTRGARRIRVDP
ncbi:threonine aspartase [Colletotrichum truncatum]|uniref:Threonine aspartase n=1 Tax=Colletotrichum truncatum TaxID=5467 RepID=A0ACC3Z9W4_COLTU|nr:threonine aspartase [Colletotrichum truncatum]KAF6796054.1 threonine aspartase [Colletotrichum truncatum]